MTVHFARWGNSVAVRIPSSVLRELGVSEGVAADLNVVSGKLVLSPIETKPTYTREELLAGMTDENVHDELEFGPPVGSETW